MNLRYLFTGKFTITFLALVMLYPALTLQAGDPPAKNGVTFVVQADVHCMPDAPWKETLEKTIAYINALPGTEYPAEAGGGKIDTPRGLIINGDVTDSAATGCDDHWDEFLKYYGLKGEKAVKFPVYEGLGNHDCGVERKPRKGMIARNKLRPHVTAISPREREGETGGRHYSWDWDNIHLVQMNYGRDHDEEGSLAFLKQDLAKHVGNSGRPVILNMHIPPFSKAATNSDALFEAIKDYNIIAIFAGHHHNQVHTPWKGIDVYLSGAVKGRKANEGEFLVVRIKDNQLTIACRRGPNWVGLWKKEIKTGKPLRKAG